MAGLARLAVESGHQVTGSDTNLYPPMSYQLDQLGIEVHEGYDIKVLQQQSPDLVIVGNALSRGNECLEYVLSQRLPHTSGPAWLKDNILRRRHVIAVAGTHGKTTVASLLIWMLFYAGLDPGFLVGGVPENFEVSARLGSGKLFVIEADEYDTAFDDKRSKFVHYLPSTLVITNLEFDHADIFPDLDAIERQFHHLVRTLPHDVLIIRRYPDLAIDRVLGMGCWSRVTTFGKEEPAEWKLTSARPGEVKMVSPEGKPTHAPTKLLGEHNAWNTIAAVAAASEVGLKPETSVASLSTFKSVKRRLELRGIRRGVKVFDDFAHHPTAFAATIAALRSEAGHSRIFAIIELGSHTMRMGVHQERLAESLRGADAIAVLVPDNLAWDIGKSLTPLPKFDLYSRTDTLITDITAQVHEGDNVLIMSNREFDNIHERLLEFLSDSS